MIGNDVVDLRVAKLENNWQRPRYLSKLFSKKEQELIASAKNKTVMVWRLWSMKEATYKAHQRRFDQAPKFNPKTFECSLVSSEKGKVLIGASNYETVSIISSEFVRSVAKSKGQPLNIYSQLEKSIDKEALKISLKKYLSQNTNLPISTFKIRKDENQIPWIFKDDVRLENPFSLSHHGKFSLFSFQIDF